MKSGMSEGRATATAINACKRWRSGGGNVSPEVRAAATAALAELEAKEARAKATTNRGSRRTREFAWDPSQHPRVGAGNTGGGRFAPKSGAAVSPSATTQRQSPSATRASRKTALHRQASSYRTRAVGLERQVTSLKAQRDALHRKASAPPAPSKPGKQAAKSAAGKATKTKRTSTARGTHRRTSHSGGGKSKRQPMTVEQINTRIRTLRGTIKQLLSKARQLDAKANKL